MQVYPRMTGLLLAGGRSRRMGTDKAALVVDGEPLAARVAAALATVCATVIVASGDGERLAWLGLTQVPDALRGKGPLSGIVAGLEAAATEYVAVVAVDMPEVSPPVLRALASALARDDAPAMIPEVGGRTQPLHAVYRRTAAPALRTLLHGGVRSVREACAAMGAATAGPQVWAAADPDGRFATNLNRPEDLTAFGP